MNADLINYIHQYCTTQEDYFALETYAAHLQGKGWGTATIGAEVKACLSLIGTPETFIDIGGNHGLYTQVIVDLFPNVEAHVFEPASTNVRLLNEKFSHYSNVTVNGKALSKERGELTLYSDKPGSGLASLTKRNIDHVNLKMDLEETVEVIRLDEYWTGDSIDYVKIDVEGHELDVLEGFGTLIENTKLIQFEFGGCNIDTKTHFRDFWYYFTDRGFDLYRISPFGPIKIRKYTEYDEHYMTTNYIATRML